MRRFLLMGLAACSAGLLTVPIAAASEPPTIVDLRTLGGPTSTANAVERIQTGTGSATVVVGTSSIGGRNPMEHAFAWRADVGMVDLQGASQAKGLATGVASNGRVVGWAQDPCSPTCPPRNAMSWTVQWGTTPASTVVTTTVLGPSQAAAVNPSGTVVVGNTGSYATKWADGNASVPLPADTTTNNSQGTAVSDTGATAGTANWAPAVWTGPSGPQRLPNPLGKSTDDSGFVLGISEPDATGRHLIAGSTYRSGGDETAVVWTVDQGGVATAQPVKTPARLYDIDLDIAGQGQHAVGMLNDVIHAACGGPPTGPSPRTPRSPRSQT